ncbi:FMN-binding protein [Agaribacterium sp. ZY112]|uniref:FMN-binding protein n=1 Tax=Agaribacterium sp. ZY112 TaxID=3233574 RepID=UPI003526726B
MLCLPLALITFGKQSFAEEDRLQAYLASLSAEPAEQEALWLNKADKSELLQRFDYRLGRARLRYWQQGQIRTWILDEVGKERPITMAISVEQGHIRGIEVLEYRESRGSEIRYPFFRKQFLGASLSEDTKLDRRIDGITGATLSVRAMKKVAKVALYLDKKTSSQEQ